ncbi:hypothetical protein [Parafrankia sp. FMc2]
MLKEAVAEWTGGVFEGGGLMVAEFLGLVEVMVTAVEREGNGS